ncbi:MAG TPA: hypothetical protein VN922_04260 [Bacteroidia bacterium]|nr:hypothetical protein [Bacteroidia bacterium]
MVLKPIFIITTIALLLFVIISSSGSFVSPAYAAENAYLISVSKDLLSIVSFLLAPSSFILGLGMQAAGKSTKKTIRYFKVLILALVIPSIIIIIYAIFLTLVLSPHVYIGSTIDPEDIPYLFLLFLLFAPTGAILFLTKKIHADNNR